MILFIVSCGKTKKNVVPFMSEQQKAKQASIIPSVNDNATLTSITVSPALVTIAQNTHAVYTATGLYSDGSYRDITKVAEWSSESSVATVVSSSYGTFLGASIGSGDIKASYESKSATAKITVTNATLVSITVSKIPTLPTGTKGQYIATGVFSDGTTQDITNLVSWSSSNVSSIAISQTGLGTAGSVGTSTITATSYPTLGNISGNTSTNVTAVTLVSISVTGLDSIYKGSLSNYKAIGTYSDGSKLDITSLVTWSSSNSSLGFVSDDTANKGLFNGVAVGSVTLTAILNGVSGTKPVSIIQSNIAQLQVQPSTATIAKNTNRQFSAIATFSDGTLMNVTNSAVWTSSNNSIAGVATSSTSGGLATGVTAGTVTLTATLGGMSGTASLTVTNATLVSINIGSNLSVYLNGTKQLTATGTFSDGSTQDITSLVFWQSSNTNIGSISNSTNSKGLLSGDATGTVNLQASVYGITSNIVTASVIGTISGNNANFPSGYTANTTPSGNFTGVTYNGGTDVAGFIASVPDRGTTGCTTFGTAVIGLVSADTTYFSGVNQVGSNLVGTNPNCSAIYELSVTTTSNRTTTDVSNRLISTIGVNTVGGTVSVLPTAPGGSTSTNTFRIIVQATYSTTGSELVGVGVSSEANYAANQAVLTNFLNGTNIRPTTAVYASKTDSFTAANDPKVDFVWVVDNSGSMASEQTAVSNAATTFFSKLSNKHIDYRLGVIATGGKEGTNNCTSPGTDGHVMRPAGWVTSSTPSAQSTFTGTNGTTVGTNGCGTESGIWFAHKALGQVNGVSATLTPRSGSTWSTDSKLVFVMVSDEADQFRCFNGTYTGTNRDDFTNGPCFDSGNTALDNNNNVFKNNGYVVHSIIGLNGTNPATCTGAGGSSADNANNAWPGYKNLSDATGGSVASICNTSFDSIMDTIVNSAAANSSSYVLNKIPVSNTIVVKKNGSTVTANSTNGWQYNASTNSIIFAGTSWPTAGESIEVTYEYDSNYSGSGSGITAFLSKSTNSFTSKIALIVILMVGTLLLGRQFYRSKETV